MTLVGVAVLALITAALAWWLTRATDFWTRLGAAGFLLVPLALVVQAAAGNVTGVSASPIPVAVVALIAAVVIAWTKRFYVPALVIAVFTALLYFVFGSFGLGHSDSFSDFMPSVMSLAGALLAIVGTWKARVARRKASPTPPPLSAVWTGAAILVLISATSAARTIAQPSAVDAPAGAELVSMREDIFDPDVLTAKVGDRVTVFVRNDDTYAHTFTIDDFALDAYVGPRRSRLITFTVPTDALKGRSRAKIGFYCAVTGHGEMDGTLEIER